MSGETADRIGKGFGMLRYGGGDPGVRQLQQQRPPRAKENRRLAVDPPRQRLRAKDSLEGSGRRRANGVETVFKIINGQRQTAFPQA